MVLGSFMRCYTWSDGPRLTIKGCQKALTTLIRCLVCKHRAITRSQRETVQAACINT